MSLYDDLTEAGCEIDSHASDLYVKATDESRAIVERWKKAEPNHSGPSYFFGEIDHTLWMCLPFMYAPFWRDRGCTA